MLVGGADATSAANDIIANGNEGERQRQRTALKGLPALIASERALRSWTASGPGWGGAGGVRGRHDGEGERGTAGSAGEEMEDLVHSR